MCEIVELSYVSGLWPGWGPKYTAATKVRSLGFRVLLSYYVAEERGSVAVNCRRSQAVELNLSLSVVRIQRSAIGLGERSHLNVNLSAALSPV